VEQPSGVFLFDQSCQRAVIDAAPFPPLPRDYGNEYVGVHFSFKFVPAQP
jgi:outer membrane biosynthesis protein TonB